MWLLTLVLMITPSKYEIHFVPAISQEHCVLMQREAINRIQNVVAAQCDVVKQD